MSSHDELKLNDMTNRPNIICFGVVLALGGG